MSVVRDNPAGGKRIRELIRRDIIENFIHEKDPTLKFSHKELLDIARDMVRVAEGQTIPSHEIANAFFAEFKKELDSNKLKLTIDISSRGRLELCYTSQRLT